jgi:hypothetical protein
MRSGPHCSVQHSIAEAPALEWRGLMMRIACALLILTIAAPSQAQSWRVLADEASRVIALRQVPASSPPRLSQSGFLWTGIALIAGGGGMIYAANRAPETCNVPQPEPGCDTFARVFRTAGGALFGSGGVVLGVGAWKRRGPSIAFSERQVAVRFAF